VKINNRGIYNFCLDNGCKKISEKKGREGRDMMRKREIETKDRAPLLYYFG